MMAALLTACQETLEERGAREARDYTEKHCPAPVAPQVVMDSMTFDKATHTFGYYYTLDGVFDDSANLQRNSPRDLLLNQVRNTTNLKLYKEAGYRFRYVYHSSKEKGTRVLDATFRKKDYQ
jgi:hypothetical protein